MAIAAVDYRGLAKVHGISDAEYEQQLTKIQQGNVNLRRLQAEMPRNTYSDLFPLLPKQKAFSLLPQLDALAHGAGGTGKSELLLALALQYVHKPNYKAIIFRRTFKQLMMPDSMLDRFLRRLRSTRMEWDGSNYTARFPEGAVIKFAHMNTAADRFDYDSSSYHFVGFDEANQFSPEMLEFMFLRLRKTKDDPLPLRYRLATNPGGISHLYLRNKYVENIKRDVSVAQMPFYLEDNPQLDVAAYLKSLEKLDPITFKQRRYGDWYVSRQDVVMPRDWLKLQDHPVTGAALRVRFWDLAATEPKKGKDPDYLVGTLMAYQNGRLIIEDVQRDRLSPAFAEKLVTDVTKADGPNVYSRFEQEPGASGKSLINAYSRLLAGYNVAGVPASGPKLARWGPLASQARNGNVAVVTGPWCSEWLNEVTNVTGVEDVHDDQMDSAAGAYNCIVGEFLQNRPGVARVNVK